MTIFSQGKEQEYISFYFGDRQITVASLGENNGLHLSNVRHLLLNGSRGLLVEPAPKVFNDLQVLYADREDVVCVNVAVADYNGKSTLFNSGTHLNKGDESLLSSLSKDEIKKWEPTTEFSEIEVHVVTWDKLMNLSPYYEFELISCDCEGMDYLITKQIDLQKHGVEMLIVEFNGKDKDKFDNLVIPQGYSLFYQNAENLIYTISK